MAQTVNQQSIDWQAVGEETIRRLQDLLRLDTRNPPGNEIRAAEYLRAVFQAEGIPGEIVGPSGDRGTFIARLKGDGSAPPLLLMGHTDVVAVEPEKWTHDPFSGDIADGFIYGRGALGHEADGHDGGHDDAAAQASRGAAQARCHLYGRR